MISYGNTGSMNIVLASRSPRRRLLLEQVGINFEIITPRAEETQPEGNALADTVLQNAEAKALSVLDISTAVPVLGADTLVDLHGDVLGKPSDSAEAVIMLSKLSGALHKVYTGIVVIDSKTGTTYRDHAVTEVRFRTLTAEEIDDYVRSGDPLDKAGSYGIQGRGALFVESINGCFYNVMGLPLSKLWQILLKL